MLQLYCSRLHKFCFAFYVYLEPNPRIGKTFGYREKEDLMHYGVTNVMSIRLK